MYTIMAPGVKKFCQNQHRFLRKKSFAYNILFNTVVQQI